MRRYLVLYVAERTKNTTNCADLGTENVHKLANLSAIIFMTSKYALRKMQHAEPTDLTAIHTPTMTCWIYNTFQNRLCVAEFALRIQNMRIGFKNGFILINDVVSL